MSARKLLPALLALLLCLVSGSTASAQPAHVQANFKVLAFYNGTWDPAHIDFVKEAESGSRRPARRTASPGRPPTTGAG